jgi:hypothetical protein
LGGDVKLALKTRGKRRHSSGIHASRLHTSEFIEKLVALMPPPRSHLVRWSGVFAPNLLYRADITLRPEIKKGFHFVINTEEEDKPRECKNYKWSMMLA